MREPFFITVLLRKPRAKRIAREKERAEEARRYAERERRLAEIRKKHGIRPYNDYLWFG